MSLLPTPEQIAQSELLTRRLGGVNVPAVLQTALPEVLGNQTPVEPQAPVQHRGMFGIKGTLRDVLGTLGDAFLVQSGRNPVYAPHRANERRSEALSGFNQDPLAAIERLRALDPAAADEMLRNLQTQQRQQAELAIAQTRAGQQTNQYNDQVLDRAARMLGTANAENYPAVKDQIGRYLSARGVTSPYTLPDSYDSDAIDRIRMTGVPVIDQERIADTEEYRAEQLRLREQGLEIQREGLGIRRSDTAADNARGDRAQGERERSNRERERQGRDRVEIERTRSARGGQRRQPPATPQQGQRRVINGVTYEWRNGRAVRVN